MANWTDPRGDLRIVLADTADDNLVKEKRVLGPVNGQNRVFYTFDDRLLASGRQSVAGSPLRLFYNAVEQQASGILVTDEVRGEFEVMVVPSGVKVVATYHHHQHLDGELDFFLQQASNQLSVSTASDIAKGLQAAALAFAAAMAHMRLAQRWQQRKSEQFLLQDEPARKEAEEKIAFHQSEARRLAEESRTLRRDYYDLRQDRGRAPAFTVLNRVPSPYTPRR